MAQIPPNAFSAKLWRRKQMGLNKPDSNYLVFWFCWVTFCFMITDWIGYHPVPLSNCFSVHLGVQKLGLGTHYVNLVLEERSLTADSALCRGFLVAGLFPGNILSTGVLTADDKGGVAGSIPGLFLMGRGAIFWVLLGGLLSRGMGVLRRTGKPSAHLL